MTLNDLTQSTNYLPPMSADILLELNLKEDTILEEVSARDKKSVYRIILEYNLLRSSFDYFLPEAFIKNLLSLYGALYHKGVSMTVLANDFKSWQKCLTRHLSKQSLKKVIPYVRWIINYHHHLVTNARFNQLVSES